MTRIPSLAPAFAVLLTGCQPGTLPDVTRLIEPSVIEASDMTPPSSEPGVCWGHEPGPQVTEIVSQTVMVEEAKYDANGKEISPAIFRKVAAPKVINDGNGRWFERVCDAQATPDLVMTLQRALAARGHYRGADSGVLDAPTRRAVRMYQREQGLDSGILSLSAAQQLGLIAVELTPEVVDEG